MASPESKPQPQLTHRDYGGAQTLIYTLQAEHVEMKGLVNKFSYGLGQLDEVRVCPMPTSFIYSPLTTHAPSHSEAESQRNPSFRLRGAPS